MQLAQKKPQPNEENPPNPVQDHPEDQNTG